MGTENGILIVSVNTIGKGIGDWAYPATDESKIRLLMEQWE